MQDRSSYSTIVFLGLVSSVAVGAALYAGHGETTQLPAAAPAHEDHGGQAPAALVQIVRDATRPFLDSEVAIAAGYGPFLGCVSGPETGAMGTTSTARS